MEITIRNKPKGSITNSPQYQRDERFGIINYITELMERDYIEKALELINLFFKKLTILEKEMLTLNILEATKQYEISSNLLPESYYDFLASNESNNLFFKF